MDKNGYKTYLQLLGNQQHYIGFIQKLVDLEKELNIDLDDYIPYNGDNSRIDALEAILSTERLYDEQLQFSINSYMRFRLRDCNKNIESKKEVVSEDFIQDRLIFNGTYCELKSILSAFMSEQDATSFINGLKTLDLNLRSDELIKMHTTYSYPKDSAGFLYSLVGSTDYNINITAFTLTLIALLLDIKLTLGFSATTLAILGFNNHAIVRLDVSGGEKCLVLEAMQRNNRIIDEDVFSLCNSECIHNNLTCRYKCEDKYTMEKDIIKRTLDGLCDKNVFRKIGAYYKYNF